jgi:hypothetical protein
MAYTCFAGTYRFDPNLGPSSRGQDLLRKKGRLEARVSDQPPPIPHASLYAVIVQNPRGRSADAWNRAQVFVYCPQIDILKALEDGPGHDLQQITV